MLWELFRNVFDYPVPEKGEWLEGRYLDQATVHEIKVVLVRTWIKHESTFFKLDK